MAKFAEKTNVGVVGAGVIGKRVADAVAVQPDMRLAGIVKTKLDYGAELLAWKGHPLFLTGPDRDKEALKFAKAGIKVAGNLDDLLQQADVVVDATPEDVGVTNKPAYQRAGVRVVFQGGEEADVAQMSFSSYANYNEVAATRPSDVRNLSCNTTGLARTLSVLQRQFGIERSGNTSQLTRRAADPAETKKGPINSIEVDKHLSSHHGADLATVLRGFNLRTSATKVPETLMHVQTNVVTLQTEATAREVLDVFGRYPRILQVSYSRGVKGTAEIMEIAREFGRPRSDMYEVVVWDNLEVIDGRTVIWNQAVHQESIVIPETIDAIRALQYGAEMSAEDSIRLTDRSLGIFGMVPTGHIAVQQPKPVQKAAPEPSATAAVGNDADGARDPANPEMANRNFG